MAEDVCPYGAEALAFITIFTTSENAETIAIPAFRGTLDEIRTHDLPLSRSLKSVIRNNL